MAMPTGLAPVVGQQVTLHSADQTGHERIDLMINQARAGMVASGAGKTTCDLVAQGIIDGEPRSWLMDSNGQFQSDRYAESVQSDGELRALALKPGNRLTYLCAPPGSGFRIALDRDEDGLRNLDDAVLFGKRPTSVLPANPFADMELDEVKEATEAGYDREEFQLKKGMFPNFEHYWAL